MVVKSAVQKQALSKLSFRRFIPGALSGGSLGLSLLVHISLFAIFWFAKPPDLNLRNSESTEPTVEFLAIDESTQTQPASSQEVQPFNSNEVLVGGKPGARANDIIQRLKKKTVSRKLVENSQALKKMDKQDLINKLETSKTTSRLEKLVQSSLNTYKLDIKLADVSANNSTEKKGTGEDVSSQELMQIISKNDKDFQSCYEKALMVDENLGGQVDFIVETGHTGLVTSAVVQFAGKGSLASQAQLKNCLRSISRKFQFPTHLKTAKVKFNLIMI